MHSIWRIFWHFVCLFGMHWDIVTFKVAFHNVLYWILSDVFTIRHSIRHSIWPPIYDSGEILNVFFWLTFGHNSILTFHVTLAYSDILYRYSGIFAQYFLALNPTSHKPHLRAFVSVRGKKIKMPAKMSKQKLIKKVYNKHVICMYMCCVHEHVR